MSEQMKSLFEFAADVIDPSIVLSRVLNNGEKMPVLGLGTFGSDSVSAIAVGNAVIGAAEFGQRLFDYASVYGNEKEIGKAFKVIFDGGIPREALFILSKVWNDRHGDGA